MVTVDATVGKIEVLREYVLDYVVGVLWLLAIGTWHFAVGHGSVVRELLSAAGAALPAGGGSEFFTAFLLLIGGVIVPYSVAMAFRPGSWLVMNIALRLHTATLKTILRRDAVDNELRRNAVAIVKRLLHVNGEPTPEMFRLYLGASDADVARRVQHMVDHVGFQSLSLLPSSLFLAGAAQNLLPSGAGLGTAIITFIIVFALGARATNRAFFRLNNVMEMAVVLVAARRGDGIAVPNDQPEVPGSSR